MEKSISKKVIDICVRSFQRARSITNENDTRILGLNDWLFSEEAEALVWKWSNMNEPSPNDAANAIALLKMRDDNVSFILSYTLAEKGKEFKDFYDNPHYFIFAAENKANKEGE